ncbi:hypothetical protein AB0N64_06290 [Microbacterium sp. NPDC089318]
MDEAEASWSDEDDAAVAFGSVPDWHPSRFVALFRTAMTDPDASVIEGARLALVTPESIDEWGDFAEALDFATGPLKISSYLELADRAPDVAYVRLVSTENAYDDASTLVATWASLVWRPEIQMIPESAWRIHSLARVDPQNMPRTAHGFDPRTLPG